MNSICLYGLALIFTCFGHMSLLGQNTDQSLQPYLKIVSKNSKDESLPLKSSIAEIKIAGVISDVTIRQVFQNRGGDPIDAIYVFPGSTKAAVYAMEMKVAGRVIKAIIQEKSAARKIYKEAKSNRKRASLLEQNRPNIFTMNVANIQPGEEIEVTLKYTEKNEVVDGEYSFIYPGVVGPRFTGEDSKVSSSSPNVPYSLNNGELLYEFSLNVDIMAGMPIQDISCSTHKINTIFQGLESAQVLLDSSETNASNRDFILRYRLAGNQIASGLLLYESNKENHFMLTIQPPKNVKQTDIPNREYVFVVDVSGSMNGFPLTVTKKLMRNLLTNLKEGDRFNVMLFAGTSNVFRNQPVSATKENIASAIEFLGSRSGGGGTRLMNALNSVMKLTSNEEGLSRFVVIISDGYISVEKEVFNLIRSNLNRFNYYAFGIGSSVNRFLMEGIAHIANSEPIIVTSSEDATAAADKFRKYIATPVLTDITIDWGGFDAYDMEPYSFSDVLAERPLVITGKYRNNPQGTITLSGVSGCDVYEVNCNIDNVEAHEKNKAVKYLWARDRIRVLDDYVKVKQDSKTIAEVTQLGLDYNLLTNYTSFVAVDNEVVSNESDDGLLKTIQQPLPLPKGVSSYAIGSAVNPTGTVGAEFNIVGKEKGGRSSFNYNISANKLAEIEILFIELELRGLLKSTYNKLKISTKVIGKLQMRISPNGQLSILNKESLSPELLKIAHEMETHTIKYRKDENVDVELSIY